MKIYKIAHEIEVEEVKEVDFDSKTNYPTYISIGHPNTQESKEIYLWIYANGKFESIRNNPGIVSTHVDRWPWMDDVTGTKNGFRGRFDPETGIVSVLKEGKINRNRTIPDFLIGKLKEAYPTLKKIYVFD